MVYAIEEFHCTRMCCSSCSPHTTDMIIAGKMVLSSLVPSLCALSDKSEPSHISWVRTNEIARLVFVLYLSGFGVKCLNVAR